MRVTRNLLFLLIVGMFAAGGAEARASSASDCDFPDPENRLTIQGEGDCLDMSSAIWFVTVGTSAQGSGCANYCDWVAICDQYDEIFECWPLWYDPEFCDEPPADTWYCNCLCAGSERPLRP